MSDPVSAHVSPEQGRLYLDRRLPPAELLEVDDHLAECEPCHRRIHSDPGAGAARLRDVLAAGLAEARAEHLTHEQLSASVDGRTSADEREVISQHVASCRMCAAELEDLRRFRNDLASDELSRRPLLSQTTRRTGRAGWRFGLVAATALAASVALWLTSIRPLRRQLAELSEENQTLRGLRDELAQLRRANQELRARPGEAPTAEAAVAFALADGGHQIRVAHDGSIRGLPAIPDELRGTIEEAVRRGMVARPAVTSQLAGRTSTLLGEAREGMPIQLESPVATVVLSDRPTFRWNALAGARDYLVVISDERLNVVERSAPLDRTVFRPARPLGHGRVYTWQVRARRGETTIVSPQPPAPEARFKVIEAAEASRVQSAASQAQGSHLALGILYASSGLVDDAERELTALLSGNPSSPFARKLLAGVRSWRRPR